MHGRSSAEPTASAVTNISHPHVTLMLFLKPPPLWQSPFLRRTQTGDDTRAAAWGCVGCGECGGPPRRGWQAVSETNCIAGCHVGCSARFSLASPVDGGKMVEASVLLLELPNCHDHMTGLTVRKCSWHWGYLHW